MREYRWGILLAPRNWTWTCKRPHFRFPFCISCKTRTSSQLILTPQHFCNPSALFNYFPILNSYFPHSFLLFLYFTASFPNSFIFPNIQKTNKEKIQYKTNKITKNLSRGSGRPMILLLHSHSLHHIIRILLWIIFPIPICIPIPHLILYSLA